MTQQPETKGLVLFGAILIAVVAAGVIYIASSPNADDTPKARLERIRDECDKTYGKATHQSVDCFTKLMTRMAIEQKRDDLDRTYQKAR